MTMDTGDVACAAAVAGTGHPAAGPDRSVPAPIRHRTLHVLARRFVNPVVMGLGIPGTRRSPIGLVIHVGRRSGRTLATPLAVHEVGERFFIPLTYGPGAHWCQNVLVAGACRLRLHGGTFVLGQPGLCDRRALPRSLRRFYRLVGIGRFLCLRLVARDQPARR